MSIERDTEYVRWYPLLWHSITQEDLMPNWRPHLQIQKDALAIYIHFPFCFPFCDFCPFLKEKYDSKAVEVWYQSVVRHLILLRDRGFFDGREARTIYWGGGTPSLAPAKIVRRLMEVIRNTINSYNLAEVSFEAKPQNGINDYLNELCETAGVTRYSFGVQSFKQEMLNRLGSGARITSIEKTFLKLKRSVNLSIDLLYHCPEQTQKDLLEDLSKALDLGVDQVSLYELIVTPRQPFWNQKSTNSSTTQQAFEMFLAGVDFLKQNNLPPVLVSDFAREGTHSIYQVEHWRSPQLEVIGIGPGAISYFGGYQYANLASLSAYTTSINNNRLPVLYGSPLSCEEELCRNLAVGFKGLSVDTQPLVQTFGELFKPHLSTLKQFMTDGLLVKNGAVYTLTEKGVWFVDNVSKGFYSTAMNNATIPLEDDLLLWTEEWVHNYV